MKLSESEKPVSLLERQRSEGEAMVAAWQASGLSMRAYAQQAGINERRLGAWRRRLATVDVTEPAFVSVSVTTPDDGLTVIVDERVRIVVTRSTDLTLLRHTIAALQC